MTQVCLLGSADVTLRYELLSRETAREALATYDLRAPFRNSVAVETVSLGAAVALCNDLNWYLVRFVDDVLDREPSVSEDEWLSRDLATAIRDDEVDPASSGRFLKVYGVPRGSSDEQGVGGREGGGPEAHETEQRPAGATAEAPGEPADGAGLDEGRDGPPIDTDEAPGLVEPMYVTRTGQEIPTYDLRDVDGTVLVRVTEAEFGA
jgi:hypothetical protein